MPVQTSVITGTVAHKHSATGGSSDGGKLATGGLGGDTSFDLASGSIMYSNGTSLEELVIGGTGTVLTEAGGVPTWASGGSGFTMTTQSITGYTNNQTTTSSPLVDILGSSWTLANRASGKAYITAFHTIEANGVYLIGAGLHYDGSDQAIAKQITHSSGAGVCIAVSGITDTDGGTVKGRWRTSGGTATLKNGTGENSACYALELS